MRLFEWFGTLYNRFNKKQSITDTIQSQLFDVCSLLDQIIPRLGRMVDRHDELKQSYERALVAKKGKTVMRINLQKVEPVKEAVLKQLIILNKRCHEMFEYTPADPEGVAMAPELYRIISFLDNLKTIIENCPREGADNELGSLNDRLREVTLLSKNAAEYIWKLDELQKQAKKRFKNLQITPELARAKMPLLIEVFEKSRPTAGTSPEYHLDKSEEDAFVTQARFMNDFRDPRYRIEFREWWSHRPMSESDLGHKGAPHINIDKMTLNGATKLKLHVFFDKRKAA